MVTIKWRQGLRRRRGWGDWIFFAGLGVATEAGELVLRKAQDVFARLDGFAGFSGAVEVIPAVGVEHAHKQG